MIGSTYIPKNKGFSKNPLPYPCSRCGKKFKRTGKYCVICPACRGKNKNIPKHLQK